MHFNGRIFTSSKLLLQSVINQCCSELLITDSAQWINKCHLLTVEVCLLLTQSVEKWLGVLAQRGLGGHEHCSSNIELDPLCLSLGWRWWRWGCWRLHSFVWVCVVRHSSLSLSAGLITPAVLPGQGLIKTTAPLYTLYTLYTTGSTLSHCTPDTELEILVSILSNLNISANKIKLLKSLV